MSSLFNTIEERDNFLTAISINPSKVNFGDAMKHARETKMGLFGDNNQFRQDVACIMLAEIRRYAIENEGVDVSMSAYELSFDHLLIQAIEVSQHSHIVERGKAIEEMGRMAGNQSLIDSGLHDQNHKPPNVESIDQIHVTIFKSLKNSKLRRLMTREPI